MPCRLRRSLLLGSQWIYAQGIREQHWMCLCFPPQLQLCNQSCLSRWCINYKKKTSCNFSPSKGTNWYISNYPEPYAWRSKVSHGCCWGSGPRNWIFCLLKIVNESTWGHASRKIYIARSDKVGDGQECAVVEAMKMQNSLSSGVNIVKHIIIIRWGEQHTFKP